MTMTLADAAQIDDGTVTPRADRPKRRTFTVEYKTQTLTECDAADRRERGAILRREDLHSSHIVQWRKAGAASALGPKAHDQRDREVEQFRTRAQKDEAELARTKTALDLMGKAHTLLETLSESTDTPKRLQR